jgi:hypothetical protein
MMKIRLAIAALMLACAPFAAEAGTTFAASGTHNFSTTQGTHYNSITASKLNPTSVFNRPGFSYPTSVLNPPSFSYPTSVLNR